ncbi:hypothetical protein JHK87_000827 [Glycine soja]|nr:hypothetical protein JHK87_000827 [Glycine soja]KAG5088207.1 hypothetical protein JHK86_000819 [Glycine max]
MARDTNIKVYEDVGDFINDGDLMPFEIVFYWDVCGKEISGEDMVSSNRKEFPLETRATFLRI